jgi:hypothetical protein
MPAGFRTLKERVTEEIDAQLNQMRLYCPDDDVGEFVGYLIHGIISTVSNYEQQKAALERRTNAHSR